MKICWLLLLLTRNECIRAEMNFLHCTKTATFTYLLMEKVYVAIHKNSLLVYFLYLKLRQCCFLFKKTNERKLLTFHEVRNSLDLSITEDIGKIHVTLKIQYSGVWALANFKIMNTWKNSAEPSSQIHALTNICVSTRTHAYTTKPFFFFDNAQIEKWNGMEKSCHSITSALFFLHHTMTSVNKAF